MSTGLRELGSTHGFLRSDSMSKDLTAFLQSEDRVQLLGIPKGYGMACVAPSFLKADGAGYAEDLSGAEGLDEDISGIGDVSLE